MQEFKGKVAVITGAASGIGYALAKQGAGLGMSLVLADINQQRLDELREELSAQGANVLVMKTDVSKPEALDALADAAYQRFGQVDVLFNNAGVLISGFSWERSVADWRWILDINLMGVVHGIRSFVPRMLAQGTEGHIVNTSSLAGLLAAPLMGPYTVSKQAVVALTETLHYELQSIGAQLSVSVLCPGPIATDIAQSGQSREIKSAVSDQANDQLMGFLTDGIAAGMSAAECAERVFAAIQVRQFWIFTHEDFKPEYQQRMDKIIASQNPEYQLYTVTE
ncbi:SDR family NAD(P)-dependent oxidoreductase [Oceanicoccus sp. KOV_DT_Chl]|uniref:SDR family NAD(P)-dependent oxidoreductase n=1 Tax=Oceanicoccus sp. KOV_DT_Chl TaxID=1904639 RepID=UPI000C7B684D|nr:SDR family NAD(P)-dependent oxidoreductase [Oceanicoccus sp. KOV_DT_Chl]